MTASVLSRRVSDELSSHCCWRCQSGLHCGGSCFLREPGRFTLPVPSASFQICRWYIGPRNLFRRAWWQCSLQHHHLSLAFYRYLFCVKIRSLCGGLSRWSLRLQDCWLFFMASC